MLLNIDFVTILAVFVCIRDINTKRILIVQLSPTVSQHICFKPFIRELSNTENELFVLTMYSTYSEYVKSNNLVEIYLNEAEKYFQRIKNDSVQRVSACKYKRRTNAVKIVSKLFEKQLECSEMDKILREEKKFDLALISAWVRPALIFSHIFDAPTIYLSPTGEIFNNYEIIGAPRNPLLYPDSYRKRTYNLTTWELITEIYTDVSILNTFYHLEDDENKMLQKKFGSNIPSVRSMYNDIQMIFLNTNPIWEDNRPMPMSAVFIGAPVYPESVLPPDLKSYMDKSKNGVIYISFGSNISISELSETAIQIIMNVISKIPYDVLWKWESDEMPGRPKNVKISKWFPQAAILSHPKLKLFITQGGLHSTNEAISNGVPMLGLAIFADQWRNTEKYVHHKIGLRLDFHSLSEEVFKNAIETIIVDDSYRQNIKRLHTLINDQPQPPLQRAVWWTEYVLRHGGARHLRSPAANMRWSEYLELELVFICIFSTMLVVVFNLYVICCACKLCKKFS